MKILFLVLILTLLSACTTYSIHKNPDGTTIVEVSSTRDLEEPKVDYKREGDDAEFHFSAASVDNNTEAYMSMFSMMMQMMQMMMNPVPSPDS